MKVNILFRILFPILLLSLVWSCDKKNESKAENKPKPQQKVINPDKLIGAWILSGQLQTSNTFHIKDDWKNNQKAIIKSDSLESFYFLRGDIYTQLNLKADKEFSMQQFETKTNQARYTPITGTWKIENNQLLLSANTNAKQAILEQRFDITDYSDKVLKLKIVKEVTSEVGKNNPNYDLAEQQKKFNNIIKEIGINQNDLTTKDSEFNSDFWTIINFKDYQILNRNAKQSDDLSKYSEDVRMMIYGHIWNYLPYYEPIFESRSSRFAFLPNAELDVRYQIDGSASGWCGTLSSGDYLASYQYDKSNNLIDITFSNPKIPTEVQRVFPFDTTLQKYKILAKNDYVMIWKKL